jgi:hypothetical protein
MITANLFDKQRWPDGPWKDEPDAAAFSHAESKYICVIRRNLAFSGVLCGYLVIPQEHPYHGLDHEDEKLENIKVHGGLSYSCALKDFISVNSLFLLLLDSYASTDA